MSVLIIGDLHYQPSNVQQTEIVERDIYNIISTNNIAFVIILGDVLHTHERVYTDCFNRVCKFFDRILEMGKEVFVIIGNHDRPNNRVFLTDEHPFNLYKRIPGIKIVDTCYVHEFDPTIYGRDPELNEDGTQKKMRFCFVPYVPDGMYLKALEVCNINPLEMTAFFSHSEFDGCKLSKLTKKKCDKWPLEYPLNISGHLHNEEVVQPNLFYTGTPFQHDFSDSPDKGVYLMDLKSKTLELEKIRLNVPSKIVVKIHYSQLSTFQLDPRYETRLEIIGPIHQVKKLMESHDMIAKFGHVSKKYKEETKEKKTIINPINNTKQFHEILLIGLQDRPKLLDAFRHIFPNFMN